MEASISSKYRWMGVKKFLKERKIDLVPCRGYRVKAVEEIKRVMEDCS